jgi:hypothetical protein
MLQGHLQDHLFSMLKFDLYSRQTRRHQVVIMKVESSCMMMRLRPEGQEQLISGKAYIYPRYVQKRVVTAFIYHSRPFITST